MCIPRDLFQVTRQIRAGRLKQHQFVPADAAAHRARHRRYPGLRRGRLFDRVHSLRAPAFHNDYGFRPIVVFDGEGRFVTALNRQVAALESSTTERFAARATGPKLRRYKQFYDALGVGAGSGGSSPGSRSARRGRHPLHPHRSRRAGGPRSSASGLWCPRPADFPKVLALPPGGVDEVAIAVPFLASD